MAKNSGKTARKMPPGRPFEKGKSGNPNGRPRKLPQLDTLLADVLGEEKDGITEAERILIALKKKAQAGDVRAAELLMDRAYGKTVMKVAQTKTDGTDIIWNEEKVYEAKH